MNRQLAYLQQLNRQHRLLVVFFEDADMKRILPLLRRIRRDITAMSLQRSLLLRSV